jgi:enoyl-[acyl-carrier protein] reductase II
MLRTPVCELLGIDVPVIQAGMGGPYTTAELVAAVTNAGGMGSIGTFNRPNEDIQRQLGVLRDLTDGAFAVNHLTPVLNEEAFAATLAAEPKVVSFALDDPQDYVQRAHDAGALVMHQVMTVKQAHHAAEHGVDIIIAQGGESGGFGGSVSVMTLVPQVVDAVRPVPVIAAGGIADGRGLAAALVLGAQGVNMGTRFLATKEAQVPDGYKQAIVSAASEDAVKFDAWNEIMPAPGTLGYGAVPRGLRTPFVDRWAPRPEEARREREAIQQELGAAIGAGRMHELVAFAGQTAGAISDVVPAGELVRRIVAEAEEALRAGSAHLG